MRTSYEDKIVTLEKTRDHTFISLFSFPTEKYEQNLSSVVVVKPIRKSANSASVRIYRFSADYANRIANMFTWCSQTKFEIEVSMLDSEGELIGGKSSMVLAFSGYGDEMQLRLNIAGVWSNHSRVIFPLLHSDDKALYKEYQTNFDLGKFDEDDLKDVKEFKTRFIFKDPDGKVLKEP